MFRHASTLNTAFAPPRARTRTRFTNLSTCTANSNITSKQASNDDQGFEFLSSEPLSALT